MTVINFNKVKLHLNIGMNFVVFKTSGKFYEHLNLKNALLNNRKHEMESYKLSPCHAVVNVKNNYFNSVESIRKNRINCFITNHNILISRNVYI